MMKNRPSLFCDLALAARIERVEARFVAECAHAAHRRTGSGEGFVIAVAGGAATFAEPGSPFNKVAGLGFCGLPSGQVLSEIERSFAGCGVPVQVELAHVADPAVGLLLTERGYRLEAFENVLGLALNPAPEQLARPGIEIRRSEDDEFDAWLAVVAHGAAHPDAQGLPWHEEFPRDRYIAALRDSAAAGVRRYAAVRDGALAGGAGLRIAEGIAQFAGAATAPEHRRHGVQAALLAARVSDSAAAACDVAVITTQPGSASQHNAQRQGFDLLYTRAVLVRTPSP